MLISVCQCVIIAGHKIFKQKQSMGGAIKLILHLEDSVNGAKLAMQ